MNIGQVLSSLSNLTDIIKINNEQEFVWQVLENCISKLDLVDCVFYGIDKENRLSQKAAIGPKQKSHRSINNQMHIRLGDGVVGRAGQSCSYEMIADTSKYEGYIVDMYPSYSELAVPVVEGNTLLGIIDSEHPSKNFFNEYHLELLSIISKFMAPRLAQLKKETEAKQVMKSKYQTDILHLMEVQKIYRNQELTLNLLSDIMNISPGYLCKIIENAFNQGYSELVNSYRTKEIIGRIEDGDHNRYKLAYLAFEAGFSSKSSFHYNFKKHTGKNPSTFVKDYMQSKKI